MKMKLKSLSINFLWSYLKKKKGIYAEILVFFIRERNNGRMQND